MDWDQMRRRPGVRTNRIDWYKIVNKVDSNAEVLIYDEIGFWGVTAQDFANDLKALDAKSIDVRINSPGGEVFDGFAIYNALVNHPATINVYIDGLAASAASFIAMAGDTITMAATATMMIHDGIGLAYGNASEMRAEADLLDKISDNIASVYAARAGGDTSMWRDKMRATTWYSADEAKAAGLVNTVTPRKGDEATTTNRWDLSLFGAPPQAGTTPIPVDLPVPAPAPEPAATAEPTPDEPDLSWLAEAFQEAMHELATN